MWVDTDLREELRGVDEYDDEVRRIVAQADRRRAAVSQHRVIQSLLAILAVINALGAWAYYGKSQPGQANIHVAIVVAIAIALMIWRAPRHHD